MGPLQRTVYQLLASELDGERTAKLSSTRVKFLRFCFATDTPATPRFPVFPLSLLKMMEYTVWLNTPDGNIADAKGGQNYLGAVYAWAAEVGEDDPRLESEQAKAAYTKFRSRYVTDVPALRAPSRKWAIQVGHVEALALGIDWSSWESVRSVTMYVTLFTVGLRIGHFASKRKGMARHVLSWDCIQIQDGLVAFWLASTKTRSTTAVFGTWTAAGARPDGIAALDPVRLFRKWRALAYKGDPTAPLFPARASPALPLTRSEFMGRLRRDLTAAMLLLPNAGVADVAKYSAISFRYGAGTTLWSRLPAHRLSELLDHRPPPGMESTAHYGRDATLAARASITGLFPFTF